MGKCWNCDVEITLKDEEVKCNGCNEIVRYWCWDCKKPFDIQDKESKKKLKECKVCGFFKCPHCGSCGRNCAKLRWFDNIKKLLNLYKVSDDIVQKIVDYIEKVRFDKEKRNCPEGVPISYAKGKIKDAQAKMEGFKVKSDDDIKRFNERLEILRNKEIGTEFTVGDAREPGHYGQEYRDIFNMGVCLGLVEVIKKKNKEGQEFSIFRRCDKDLCPHFDNNPVVIKICPTCGNSFDKEIRFCDVCKHKKNGRNHQKGDFIELKEKKSNKEICQLSRSEFLTKEEEKEDVKKEEEEYGES